MAESVKKKSVFETLNKINVNEHTESKNGLTYLSWAWAWQTIKENYPDAYYTIYENPQGWFYHTDGRTAWVKTGVTINDLEMIEYLPVMDFRNKSIPIDSITSFDVNKTIQRSLTKACARHGLGLYIYAGEDLPTETPEDVAKRKLKGKEVKLPTENDFQKAMAEASVSEKQISEIEEKAGILNQPIDKICKAYKINGLNELTTVQADEVIKKLDGAIK